MDIMNSGGEDFVSYSPLVQSAINHINSNLTVNLSVETIAAALFVSPSKLQKKFKAETGVSIGKYIHERIMFTAERKLRQKNMTLKEISESLGFCDQFYFSRCFSQKYGVSPRTFRNRNNI